MKKMLLSFWRIESQIRAHIRLTQAVARIPYAGLYLAMILDRILLIVYGVDLDSRSVRVRKLSIAHPSGVLLGGNGVVSSGRVAVMADVKFVARSPQDPLYLERHRTGNVFILGDNVVIGAGSTVIGPVSICDNVIVGAMSLINRDITEPGVYVGIPIRKVSDHVTQEWVQHL